MTIVPRQQGALVYSIAGYSKSGKTSVMVELISALKAKGYRTATIKDCPKNLSLDTEGKDTWKHKSAGAELAVLSTALESTILFREPHELDELIRIVQYAVRPDIILVEGHKISHLPKIWIPGGEVDEEETFDNIVLEYDGQINKLIAFVLEELEIHRILSRLGGSDCGKCGFADCREMAKAIMAGENDVDDCKDLATELELDFKSDGEPVQLNRFARNIVSGALTGMAKELKGIKDPNNIEIKLNRRGQFNKSE